MMMKKTAFLMQVTFLISLLFLAVSCSQSVPDALNADYSVIFEYADEQSLPECRLSVFIESGSDVRRYSSIRLHSVQSDLYWETDDLLRLNSSDSQWAGNANFVPPENQIIPSGVYKITMQNADEQEDSIEINIKYDESFKDCLSGDVPDLMKKMGGMQRLAVYDESGKMLYFGSRTSEMQTVRGIWNVYREAKFFQDIWCTADNSVMCILPEEAVSLE